MDYALEELLRQRRALVSLLLRGSPSRAAGEPLTEEAGATPELAAPRNAAGAEWEPVSRRDGLLPPAPGTGEAAGADPERTPQAGTGGVASRRSAGTGGLPFDGRRARRTEALPGPVWPGAIGERGTRGFSVPVPAAAGGTDARAVSRAVQRDARRYDGGFTIY